MTSTSRSVLITGAAGGLGGVTADLFIRHGWTVFAADLTPPSAGSGRVPLALDVTDEQSCRSAAEQVAAHGGGLDVVINFAGVLEIGPLVEVAPATMRRAMEINLIGTFLVNQAMFPLVLASGGRIVNISSEAGRMKAQPLSAPYSVSKHAVEAYSEALRRELMFVGVSVVTVRPGAFRTNMTNAIGDRFAKARKAGSPFEPLVEKIGRLAVKSDANALDPRILADAVWRASTAPKPKQRYNVRHNRTSALFDKVPDVLIDRILKRTLS